MLLPDLSEYCLYPVDLILPDDEPQGPQPWWECNEPALHPGNDSAEGRHLFLVLHGLGGGCYETNPLTRHINEAGYAVETVIYPGHGLFELWMTHSRWEDWFAHVDATITRRLKEYDHVSLLGFSTGCPLSVKVALKHPVASMIMLAPFFQLKSEWYLGAKLDTYVKNLHRFWPYVPVISLPIADRDGRLHAEAYRPYSFYSVPTIRSALALIESVLPYTSLLDIPLLMIQSDNDKVVCPAKARAVFDAWPGEPKEWLGLTDSNHILCWDVDKQTVIDSTLAFIQRLHGSPEQTASCQLPASS